MAKDFMSLDCGFPNFADDEPIEDKVSKLYNYTFMLLESLRYLLRNLDTDNFNAAALAEFKKEYEDKVKEKRKAEIEAKKEAIRQEDIAKGVFVPVSMLPAAEPKKGVVNT